MVVSTKEYTHNVGTFIGKGGVEIFFQSWNVPKPKGVVIIVHGLGEHSGRYENLLEKMKGKGVSFFAPDHRGHGRSGGKRGHVMSFMEYVFDLKLLVDFIRDDYEKIPLFLLGHSMGGVIALKYAFTYQEDIDGLIISSAGLVPVLEVPKWKESLGRFFSRRMPGLTMPSGLPAEAISRDNAVVKAYEDDPLVHDKVSSRWFTEFTDSGQECLDRAGELKVPILLFHGTEDGLVHPRGTEQIYEGASSRDKELYLFDGLYHETMNELPEDRERVLNMVSGWILKRIAPRKAAPKGAKGKRTQKAAPKKRSSAAAKGKKQAPKKAKKTTSKSSTKKSSRKK